MSDGLHTVRSPTPREDAWKPEERSASPNTPPHLSLEPPFRRGWGSQYGALRRGRIDAEALRDLLAATRLADWPGVFAVDASSWPRCDAECSPERGYYHHPSRHSNGQPIVAGWNYSPIAGLNWDADSWTAPLDVRRIHPAEDTGQAAAGQVAALVGRLGAGGAVPLFVFDAGYDPIALSGDLAATRAQILVRIRSDRVFFLDPAARPAGTRGRPRRHGERFACAEPASWPAPDAALGTTDARYGRVEVAAWSGLHPRLARRGLVADCRLPWERPCDPGRLTPTRAGTVLPGNQESLHWGLRRLGRTRRMAAVLRDPVA